MECGVQFQELCCSLFSSILYCISLVVHRPEKKLKENIPTLGSRGPEIASKLQNVPINHGPNPVPVLAEHQVHESYVPPLMYPPRNYADLVKDAHCARRRRARGKTHFKTKPRDMKEAAACGDEKDTGNVREEDKREGGGILKAKSAKKPTPSASVDPSRSGAVNVSSTGIGGRHDHVAASFGGLNMEKGRIDGNSWIKETLPTSSNEAQRNQQRQHKHC